MLAHPIGPYMPVQKLGAGGMAEVFVSRDDRGRRVALDHGEYDRAMAAFALVLCRQPQSRKAMAGYELCRGSRALQAGDRTTAGACFRRAWEVDLSNMAMAKFVRAFEREQAQRMALTT